MQLTWRKYHVLCPLLVSILQQVNSYVVIPKTHSCFSTCSYSHHSSPKLLFPPKQSLKRDEKKRKESTHNHNHNHNYNYNNLPLFSSSSPNYENGSISSSIQPNLMEERAGRDGYSVLRRPLEWDASSDPVFDTPEYLDDDRENLARRRFQDEQWFVQNRNTNKVNMDEELESIELKNDNDNLSDNDKAKNLDLFQRTVDTLDYPVVLKALARECLTAPARRIVEQSMNRNTTGMDTSLQDEIDKIDCLELTASSVQGVQRTYDAMKEMQRILDGSVPAPKPPKQQHRSKNERTNHDHNHKQKNEWEAYKKRIQRLNQGKYMSTPPIQGMVLDIQPILDIVDQGSVLGGPEILEVQLVIETMNNVKFWCQQLEIINQNMLSEEKDTNTFVQLPSFGKHIDIDEDLYQLLDSSLDDKGRLSSETFPNIGRLRNILRQQKSSILDTLHNLVQLPSMQKKLSLESGGSIYSEVNGRIVIPISESYKDSVGIVHDASRSGKTTYVEPTEIVSLTNDMRRAESELKREEAKIWRMLTKEILIHHKALSRGVKAVAHLDLLLARLALGEKIQGVIPTVKDEGVISLKNAKHPVLLLRDDKKNRIHVVGSDVDIGSNGNQGLVLTGPNSGGKTIILKLMGLVALMARDGIPIPASSTHVDTPPRVDFFDPVLADIGDIQSVDGDLSTFSGHMLVCREILSNSCRNALVLMDELGSGTDPNQGVAIAQSILEALVDSGARVGITTHYLELKQLASSDDRFAVAGMQFVKGRPTYKLLPGVVGESFALSVAERLRMPNKIIQRANELLDSDTRLMGNLISDMEDQKADMENKITELNLQKQRLQEMELKLRKQQTKLERTQVAARQQEAKKFAQKLEEKEEILESILQKLKSDPSKKLIARSWDEIRYVKRDALTEAENLPSIMKRKRENAKNTNDAGNKKLVPLSDLREKVHINPGDSLVICKMGSFRNKIAKVISIRGNRLNVSVNGMAMTMKLNELSLPTTSMSDVGFINNNVKESKGQAISSNNNLSKMARKALDQEMKMGPVHDGISKKSSGKSEKDQGMAMKLKSNTVDVLGCTFNEARQKIEQKFSNEMMKKNAVIYILHGHGTQGVLKQKIRDWLKRDKDWVKTWKAADASDGGDAYTQVFLKQFS